jgi:flagellar basal body-associated protein FliL
VDFLKKVLKISFIVILVVAIIYLIVGLFFLDNSKTSTNYGAFGKVVSSGAKGSIRSTDALEVGLDKILINMRSGKYRYMKADMTFRMADEDQKEAILKNMPRIRDTILKFASSLDSDIMITPEGKENFKKELQNLIYNEYGHKIDAIYFNNFVLAQ